MVCCQSSGLGQRSPDAAGPCRGIPWEQHQKDVTSQLSTVASGVVVSQLTDEGGNWISFHDVPAYSGQLHRIFYNQMQDNRKIMANPDGGDPQVLSADPDFRPTRTREIYLSGDGTLAYYLKTNSRKSTVDVYAVHLTTPGQCREVQLTNMNHEPGTPVKISTTTVDSKTGKNIIGYGETNVLHRVLDDGTKLPDVILPDRENDLPFHILRMNPKFSNIVFYRRNQPGERFGVDSLWVTDLNHPDKAYDLAVGYEKVSHPEWSNDGQRIGFNDRNANWYVADVVLPDGSLNVFHSSFRAKKIGPRDTGLDAQFCSWAPDDSQFVCITRRTGADSKIFLMSLDGATRVLASTDLIEHRGELGRPGAFRRDPTRKRLKDGGEQSIQGDTWARFIMDNQHVIFHSNRTGKPELYEITNFTSF